MDADYGKRNFRMFFGARHLWRAPCNYGVGPNSVVFIR